MLALYEIQTDSYGIWTRGAVPISHDDNHYTILLYVLYNCAYVLIQILNFKFPSRYFSQI